MASFKSPLVRVCVILIVAFMWLPLEMLPLSVSTVSSGALHCLFQLAGTGDRLCLWAAVFVTLRGFVQRLVFEMFPSFGLVMY